MSGARLSIVVPTLGRPTLDATLASIVPQLGDEDEVLVVADTAGDTDAARGLADDVGDGRIRFEECGSRSPGPGDAARLAGIDLAYGTHLLFMDDDDAYTEGALRLMRDAACDRPVIFRMDATSMGLGVLWAEPELTYANVGTPMFVVRARREALGEWTPHNELDEGSDFTFLVGCCERMGDPVWREEIVAVVRPHAMR